jgi:hypothetical protein
MPWSSEAQHPLDDRPREARDFHQFPEYRAQQKQREVQLDEPGHPLEKQAGIHGQDQGGIRQRHR